jgi:hypothetical protein
MINPAQCRDRAAVAEGTANIHVRDILLDMARSWTTSGRDRRGKWPIKWPAAGRFVQSSSAFHCPARTFKFLKGLSIPAEACQEEFLSSVLRLNLSLLLRKEWHRRESHIGQLNVQRFSDCLMGVPR